jgi:hypothetical protein
MLLSRLSTRASALSVLLCGLLLSSCEKEVDINLKDGERKLVVEGAIESGLPPYVVLTKSLGFLSRIDMSTMEDAFVRGAIVKVSDGSHTVTLREYSVDTGLVGRKFFFYTVDTTDPAAFSFRGEMNKTYRLTISYEGKNYEATTAIPEPKPLDSLWIEKPSQYLLNKMPKARVIYFRYTDPDTFGNYIRYFTRTNSSIFYPGYEGSVLNDEIVNGTSVVSSIVPGRERVQPTDYDSVGVVFVGDTVTVKWCGIDRAVYEFWSSYVYASNTTGSPFTTPINLRTNIKGGALGIWAGYGATFSTIVVKD